MKDPEFHQPTDKRVQRTRRAVREALLSLLETKSVKSITIKELSERAGINRKTFYAHYTCIDDVTAELEDELVQACRYFLSSDLIRENGLGPQFVLQFINTGYQTNPTFFENLVAVRNYSFLVDKFKEIIKDALLEMIPERYDASFALSVVEFLVSGAAALYVQWIRNGKAVPFAEVTDLAFHLIMGGIGGAMARAGDTPT